MKTIRIPEHTLIDLLIGDIESFDKWQTVNKQVRIEIKPSAFSALQKRVPSLEEWLTGNRMDGIELKDVKEWLRRSANNGSLVECLEVIAELIPDRWFGQDP